jgi:hypothetical protein
MRKILFCLLCVILATAAAVSQVNCRKSFDESDETASESPAPIFELKSPFKSRVEIPTQVLTLLRADKDNIEKFEGCRSRQDLAEIPAKWFHATQVRMAKDELAGLVVKAANACLWEKKQSQDVGGFWVFRQAPSGYELMFAEKTQMLQVLSSRTGGYPDICTTWGQYGQYSQTIYTFVEGKYLPFTNGTVIFDFFPPPPK